MNNFKHWLKINEMPITNMQFQGQWGPKAKRGYGYNWQDLGILENPNAVDKIIRKWDNSKHDFEVIFARSPQARKQVEIGEVSKDWVKEKLGFDLEPKKNTITIIFTNNTGTEKIPMTAWAIAHRLGHAIRRNKIFEEYMFREIIKDFKQLLEDVYGVKHPKNMYGFLSPQEEKDLRQLAHAVGTMSSTRNKKLVNFYEFIYELLAQYITTGKITFKPLPESFIRRKRFSWGRENNDTARTKHNTEDHEDYNHYLQGLADKYEQYLDSIFASITDKIFVM